MPIKDSLLQALVCPACKTPVELVHGRWLVCSQCDRKYPIVDDIPVMLIDEGDRYVDVSLDELPDVDAGHDPR